MPLEQAGVRFSTEGFSQFLKNIGSAAKAYATMGDMSEEALESVRALGMEAEKIGHAKNMLDGLTDTMNRARGEAKEYGDTIFSLGKAFDSAKKGFGKFTAAFGAIGNVLGGVIGLLGGTALLATPIPFVDELLAVFGGPLLGTILGSILGFTVDVTVAIGDFAMSVTDQLVEVLPKVVQKIYDFVSPIVKAFFEVGKKILSAVGSVINTVFSGMQNVLSTLSGGLLGGRGGRSLGDSLFGAMFKFEVLKQTIRKVIQEFKEFVSVSYKAAEILQTLTVRLDNLIARQMRDIGLVKDYGQSIEMASGYTQELLGWIKELAVATPFSADVISETVSLSMAMGWGIDTSKELTTSILNYTAAQGLSNDVMERIIYNFAQMRQAGKVTGTELRDLARGAFMPVNDILNLAAQKLGIAADEMDEFREAAADGTIGVELFFETFNEWANAEFPNAARNMNITMAAVVDNVRDLFRTILGWNMLKPVLDAVAKRMQSLINSINTPEVDRATKLLGMSFKYAAESLMQTAKTVAWTFKLMFEALGLGAPTLENVIKSIIKFAAVIQKIALLIQSFVIGKILPVFRQLRDELDAEMDDTADDAFTWGFNLIIEFGKGVMKGISTFLTKVMNALASFLASWLMPHSPPRIAPDIDLWGLDTIAEWLRGFTEADFGMLDSLKDNLKGALGALVDLGVLDEEISADMYVSISADLIGAIEEFNRTGEMSSVIFEQLSTVSGVFGEELVTLLNMQIELAEATERVTIAQEAYNAAVEATKQSTHLVNSSIREYNALLRAGTDQSILEQRLAEINAAEMQLAIDQQLEEAAEAELQAAEDALEPLEEMVALQEQLIQQLIDLAEAQAAAAEAAADAGGGGGGGEDGAPDEGELPFGFGELPAGEDLGAYFESLKEIALAELDVLWRELRAQWSASFQENFGEGSAFQQSWRRFVDALVLYWDTELVPNLGFPAWSEVAGIWEGIGWDDIFPFLRDEAAPIEWWQRIDGTADPTATVQDPGGLNNSFLNLSGIIQRIYETWNLFIDSIVGKEGAYKEGQTTVIQDILVEIDNLKRTLEETSLQSIGNSIGEGLIDGIVEGMKLRIQGLLISSIFGVFTTNVLEFFGIESPSKMFEDIGESLIDGLFLGISEFLVNSWTIVDEALMGFLSGVLDFFGIGKSGKTAGGTSSVFQTIGESIVTGFSNGITTMMTAISSVGGVIDLALQGLVSLFSATTLVDQFSGIGEDIIGGLQAGMESAFGSVETFLSWLISQLPDWAKQWLGIASPSTVFEEIGEDTILGLGEGIGGAAHDYIEAASPSKLFDRIGRSTMTGMAQGILSASGRVYDAMESVINSSAITPAMNMNATVRAPEVSAGGSSVNFGDVYLSDRLDLATLKSYVQSMILER